MLNTFPHLLDYAFFAPTIIRIAVSLVLLYVAYSSYARQSEIAQMRFPIVGQTKAASWISVTFYAAVGAMLLFGYYTQIAAIFALVALVKSFILKKQYPRLIPLSQITMLLLAAMCLSLLLSGAGAVAYDLPL